MGCRLRPTPPLDLFPAAGELVCRDGRSACLRGYRPGDDRLDHRPGSSAFRRGAKKKGGAAAQAIGRSRGGPSTKIVTVVSDENTVVAVRVAEGQRSDAVLAKPALEEAKKVVGRIDEVLGDKAIVFGTGFGLAQWRAFQDEMIFTSHAHPFFGTNFGAEVARWSFAPRSVNGHASPATTGRWKPYFDFLAEPAPAASFPRWLITTPRSAQPIT